MVPLLGYHKGKPGLLCEPAHFNANFNFAETTPTVLSRPCPLQSLPPHLSRLLVPWEPSLYFVLRLSWLLCLLNVQHSDCKCPSLLAILLGNFLHKFELLRPFKHILVIHWIFFILSFLFYL